MPVALTVLRGAHRGRRIPIVTAEFWIGRGADCHLRPRSEDVDPYHCALVSRDERVFLRDNRSRAGTFVNNRRLAGGEMELADGDTLDVGPLTFKVSLTPDDGSAPEQYEDWALNCLSDWDRSSEQESRPPSQPIRTSPTPPPAPFAFPSLPRQEDAQEILSPR